MTTSLWRLAKAPKFFRLHLLHRDTKESGRVAECFFIFLIGINVLRQPAPGLLRPGCFGRKSRTYSPKNRYLYFPNVKTCIRHA